MKFSFRVLLKQSWSSELQSLNLSTAILRPKHQQAQQPFSVPPSQLGQAPGIQPAVWTTAQIVIKWASLGGEKKEKNERKKERSSIYPCVNNAEIDENDRVSELYVFQKEVFMIKLNTGLKLHKWFSNFCCSDFVLLPRTEVRSAPETRGAPSSYSRETTALCSESHGECNMRQWRMELHSYPSFFNLLQRGG